MLQSLPLLFTIYYFYEYDRGCKIGGIVMQNMVLTGTQPLKNIDRQPYSKMAFDGLYFYCCITKISRIAKLDQNGKLLSWMDVRRPYHSICFDCKEECFWALDGDCHNSIYKLDADLAEIECVMFSCPNKWYTDIYYDASCDMLLVCEANAINKVSKSGMFVPFLNLGKGLEAVSAAPVYGDLFIGCKFQGACPDVLAVLRANMCFEYLNCFPKGFSVNSLCVGYQKDGNPILFALATQKFEYSYLLKYQVCSTEEQEKWQHHECRSSHKDEDLQGCNSFCITADCQDIQTDILI
jgi:hypothetical protein